MKLKEYEVTYSVATTKKVMAIDLIDAESMAKRAIHGKASTIRLHSIYEVQPETEVVA